MVGAEPERRARRLQRIAECGPVSTACRRTLLPLRQLPPVTLRPAEPPFMGISPFFFKAFPSQL